MIHSSGLRDIYLYTCHVITRHVTLTLPCPRLWHLELDQDDDVGQAKNGKNELLEKLAFVLEFLTENGAF